MWHAPRYGRERALLLRHPNRKLAVAHAHREAFDELRHRVLAVGADQFGERRARMIAGFNRGYNGFQQTYRTCTPAASIAIRRYIEEGSKISRDLTARYAN